MQRRLTRLPLPFRIEPQQAQGVQHDQNRGARVRQADNPLSGGVQDREKRTSFGGGLGWGPTYHIDPHIAAEREYQASQLRKTGLVSSETDFHLDAPVEGQNLAAIPFREKASVIQLNFTIDSNTVAVKPETNTPNEPGGGDSDPNLPVPNPF